MACPYGADFVFKNEEEAGRSSVAMGSAPTTLSAKSRYCAGV